MVSDATAAAVRFNLASAGDDVLMIAGLPSGHAGGTNLLHVARIPD